MLKAPLLIFNTVNHIALHALMDLFSILVQKMGIYSNIFGTAKNVVNVEKTNNVDSEQSTKFFVFLT